jgi:uncharacterized membrane protein YdjX (TVP38/TMEM64 family)
VPKNTSRQQTWARALLIVVILGALISFFAFDLGRFLSLPYLQAKHAELENLYAADPWSAVFIFSGVYVVAVSLGLPGAAVLTLVAGAIFGFWRGAFLVSISSTLGAIIALLSSRFLFRDWVQNKFGENLQSINRGMERDGIFYLCALIRHFHFSSSTMQWALRRFGFYHFGLPLKSARFRRHLSISTPVRSSAIYNH